LEKAGALIGALLMFIPGIPSSLVGMAIVGGICLIQRRRKQRQRLAVAQPAVS